MPDRPLAEHEGTSNGDGTPTKPERPSPVCRDCGGADLEHKHWTLHDGVYEVDRYECRKCGCYWWVEGPDA